MLERKSDGEETGRETDHLLVHSSNEHTNLGGAEGQVEATKLEFHLGLPCGWQSIIYASCLSLSSQAHEQGAGLEAEQLRLELILPYEMTALQELN